MCEGVQVGGFISILRTAVGAEHFGKIMYSVFGFTASLRRSLLGCDWRTAYDISAGVLTTNRKAESKPPQNHTTSHICGAYPFLATNHSMRQ
jgi:hypothetical protein